LIALHLYILHYIQNFIFISSTKNGKKLFCGLTICIMGYCLIDSPESLLKQVQDALGRVDVLVTSGGVSMGEKVSVLTGTVLHTLQCLHKVVTKITM